VPLNALANGLRITCGEPSAAKRSRQVGYGRWGDRPPHRRFRTGREGAERRCARTSHPAPQYTSLCHRHAIGGDCSPPAPGNCAFGGGHSIRSSVRGRYHPPRLPKTLPPPAPIPSRVPAPRPALSVVEGSAYPPHYQGPSLASTGSTQVLEHPAAGRPSPFRPCTPTFDDRSPAVGRCNLPSTWGQELTGW